MPSRIVTSTYRYKRPPRKRKAVPLTGPAIVRRGTTMPETPPAPARKPAIVAISDKERVAAADRPATVASGSDVAPSPNVRSRSEPAPVAPANDARKPAIVTARRPGARLSVEVPDMTPEELRRRGDAADALFRELVRRATGKP